MHCPANILEPNKFLPTFRMQSTYKVFCERAQTTARAARISVMCFAREKEMQAKSLLYVPASSWRIDYNGWEREREKNPLFKIIKLVMPMTKLIRIIAETMATSGN